MGADPEPEHWRSSMEVEVQRVRAPATARALPLLTACLALLVALAIFKPWGNLGAPASPPPPSVATATSPTSAPSPEATKPTPEGIADPICLGAGGWRIASLETWRTQDVRVWRALEPAVDAAGPLDPEIPTVPIITFDVQALGFCAPGYGPDEPVGPASVVAWWIVDGRASRLGLHQVVPATDSTPIAALYVPVARCETLDSCPSGMAALGKHAWRSGRVVFRYTDEGAGRVAWFAVEIEILSEALQPTPSPAAG